MDDRYVARRRIETDSSRNLNDKGDRKILSILYTSLKWDTGERKTKVKKMEGDFRDVLQCILLIHLSSYNLLISPAKNEYVL